MTSKFQFKKSLEWCTELPAKDCPRESPPFLANGSEWFFRLTVQKRTYDESWSFILHLEFKCTHTEFKPCRGKLQVGFVEEQTLSLGNEVFIVSKPTKILLWSRYMENMHQKLSSDYLKCTGIKFIFSFDDMDSSLLKICKEIDDKSVQTPLYIDTSFQLEGVSKDLSTLFDKGRNHDVEFICGDHTIKAHKNVLGCRSEVFATMFRTEMAEGKTGQVKILDIDGTIFELFLRYLYTGVLPELTVDAAMQIYEAADKYNVLALKKQSASFLVAHLSPQNACEILIISDRHSDPDFKKDVMEYVVQENVPFRGETLSNFCKDNCKVAAEVLNLLCQQLPEKNKKS